MRRPTPYEVVLLLIVIAATIALVQNQAAMRRLEERQRASDARAAHPPDRESPPPAFERPSPFDRAPNAPPPAAARVDTTPPIPGARPADAPAIAPTAPAATDTFGRAEQAATRAGLTPTAARRFTEIVGARGAASEEMREKLGSTSGPMIDQENARTIEAVRNELGARAGDAAREALR